MHPFLELGNLHIPMYGIMIVIGVFAGLLVAMLRYRINNVERQDVAYAFFYGLIGVFIGAKLLYILPRLQDLLHSGYSLWEALYALFSSGFVFYGGLIGGLVMVILYSHTYKIPTWSLFDAIIPSIPLMHSIGRIGCFCVGCCYGIPVSEKWGLLFNNSPIAPHNVYLLPIQLIESGINAGLFVFILWFARKKRKAGLVLGLYLMCYAVERFFLEYLRYDYIERGIYGPFSTSQWISLIMLPIGLLLCFLPAKYLQFPFFVKQKEKDL